MLLHTCTAMPLRTCASFHVGPHLYFRVTPHLYFLPCFCACCTRDCFTGGRCSASSAHASAFYSLMHFMPFLMPVLQAPTHACTSCPYSCLHCMPLLMPVLHALTHACNSCPYSCLYVCMSFMVLTTVFHACTSCYSPMYFMYVLHATH